jgi:hypothetical protein
MNLCFASEPSLQNTSNSTRNKTQERNQNKTSRSPFDAWFIQLMPQLTPIEIACWMTAVALMGWLIIPRLTVCLQSASKRKRFRSYIILLRRKIESTQSRDFVWDFHRAVRDFPNFETETLEVRPHIIDRNIKSFDGACAAYKTVPFGDFGDSNKNEDAKAKLISILGEISECAK